VIMGEFGSRLTRIEQALAPSSDFVDLPTLLPASMVLELAGEGLRPRLFFATAPDGSELCLRPDLTIPAAVRYIETAKADNKPLTLACKGPVFRAPHDGGDRPPEFIQIGLERFGEDDVYASDVAVFLAAWEACCAGQSGSLNVRFCDGGLMPLVLSKANLDPVWHQALSEQTSHSRAFLQVLAQASGKVPVRALSPLERDEATRRVEDSIAESDLSLAATRTAQDVARHLTLRARRTLASPLPAIVADTLDALARFQHQGSLDVSLKGIAALGQQIGVDLSPWCADWQTRFAAIKAAAPDALKHSQFDALGEEAFDYYDGMAFDIARTQDFSRPLATGGRYDRLVGELSGGSRQARAVGCVVRPDRLGAQS
jgi:ATP phosphoribosyltransferase regulatory subunit